MDSALRVAKRYLESVIRKEKGEYCVRSPNNSKWNGGCYPSKGKAKERLKEVEFFKHKKAAESADTLIEIEIKGGDGAKSLVRMLKFVKFMGDIGTSRSFYLDKTKRVFDWDGDGSDKIVSIRLNGDEVSKTDKEEREEFNNLTR